MEGDEKKAVLDRVRFHLAEHQRQDYVAIIPQGIAPDDLSNPAFWASIANQCRPWGRIEARAEDGTWIAELVITEVGRQFVRVKLLQLYELTTAEVAQTQAEIDSGYRVIWRGQHHQWGVKRLSDSAVVRSGEPSKGQAETWLREHLKAVAR